MKAKTFTVFLLKSRAHKPTIKKPEPGLRRGIN